MKQLSLLALVLSSSPILAGVISGYVPGNATSQMTYDRFVSGYPSTTSNPTMPISNSSPLFLGNGYTNGLSGVGWVDSAPQFSVSLVSQRHFIGAAHVGYSPGTKINVVNSAGLVTSATVQMTRTMTTTYTDQNGLTQMKPSDVLLGTFIEPIPLSAGINPYGILKAPAMPGPLADAGGGQLAGLPAPANFYRDQPLLNYGQNPAYSPSTHLGHNSLDSVQLVSFGNFDTEVTVGAVYSYSIATPGSYYAIGGDSGGPSFIPYDNELTLMGAHYGVSSLTPADGENTVDAFLPFYTGQLNSFMAQDVDSTNPSGYSLRLIPVPEPGMGLGFLLAMVLLRRRR